MLAHVRLIPVTNRETWVERVEIRDEVGTVFDLSEEEARLEVSSTPYGCTALTATSGDGILTTYGEGLIEWEVPVGRMRTMQPGLYDIGLTCTIQEMTVQVLVGTIEIVDGNLS